ncbi:MAG: hypothetical protein WD688_16310 [Candidatus Binatia bacterium]
MARITVFDTDSGLIIMDLGDFGVVPAKERLKSVFTGPGQTSET